MPTELWSPLTGDELVAEAVAQGWFACLLRLQSLVWFPSHKFSASVSSKPILDIRLFFMSLYLFLSIFHFFSCTACRYHPSISSSFHTLLLLIYSLLLMYKVNQTSFILCSLPSLYQNQATSVSYFRYFS